MKHLTEDEILDFLDGNLPERNEEIENHLTDCQICSDLVKQYQFINSQLETETTPQLPDTFAASIMSRIIAEEEPQNEPAKSSWPLTLSIAGTVLTLAFLGYFANIGKILGLLIPSGWYQFLSNNIFSMTDDLQSILNMDLSLIIYAGLILIVIGALDYIIRHAGRRPVSFLI